LDLYKFIKTINIINNILYDSRSINHNDNQLTSINLVQKNSKLVTKIQIDNVMDFHRRFNHISPTNMIIGMRLHVWNGIYIEPSLIESVFAHQDCEICKISKMNKSVLSFGTQIHDNILGQSISADYIGPITPLAKGGFSGFFLFRELTCGFLYAYLTTTKTNFVIAFTEVYYFF